MSSTPSHTTIALNWNDPATGAPVRLRRRLPVVIGRAANCDVVLPGARVSRRHAVIQQEASNIVIVDQGSTNGVIVNGKRRQRETLNSGDVLVIGNYSVEVILQPHPVGKEAAHESTGPGTLIFDEDADELVPLARILRASRETFPPPAFTARRVPMARLRRDGLEINETTYLSVGGGLGSFAWVDHLRIWGAPAQQIRVVGLEEKPYGRYRRLCQNSQIPAHERLRSDSGSTPDNIWGWPGYAVREIWSLLLRADVAPALRIAWQIFGEPTLAQTYTPKSGEVFERIDREARRIGYDTMWRLGHVKAIRQTDDGRYAVAYTVSKPDGRRRCIAVAPYVHVAVGYPGVRFLPDLQTYRDETGDFRAVVNAYEAHEHVYDTLRQEGGVVMLRGRGIVASRVLQRLYELRQAGAQIAVVHLLRSPLAEGNRFGYAQRPVEDHWEFQPFNWPKSCWGGELRFMLEQASPEERAQLLDDWGGTTTADRRDWKRIVQEGLREGWYQSRFGSVREVTQHDDGQVLTTIYGQGAVADQTMLPADFIVDCTGLQASLEANPLLHDLCSHYDLPTNPKGRLHVANDFEIPNLRNGQGRIYASGAMTLGGPHAAVDSFLGLQYAALRSVDALAGAGAPALRRLNGLRSVLQWTRWARGVAP